MKYSKYYYSFRKFNLWLISCLVLAVKVLQRLHGAVQQAHFKVKLQWEIDAIIVLRRSLSAEEIKATHCKTLQLAPSYDPNREGRCCINNKSFKTRRRGNRSESNKSISINERLDQKQSDGMYPGQPLPNVKDI